MVKIMTDKKRNVPKLRFRGFTETWEQRSLGDYADLKGRIGFRGYTRNDIIPKEKGGILTFSPTNIINGQINNNSKNTYITELKYNESPEIKVKNNDILFVKTGSTLGKSSLVENLQEPATINPQIVIIKSKVGNEHFLAIYLQTAQLLRQVHALKIGGAVPTLTEAEIKTFTINIPKAKAEASQISALFNRLDKLIALHQRKQNQLKKVKKALLQKMFADEKNPFPFIRFKGFTEAWEQRKLGEVVEITMGQSPSSKNYTENPNDHILVQGNADMKNGHVVPRVWTTQITKQAEKGDLILSVRAPVGDIGKTDYDVVLGRGVAAIKGNSFIFQLLTKMKINGYWTRFSTGSTFESINSDNIKNAQISIPSLREQEKIGGLFNEFDSLIALHQRKLDQLQKLKKSLLQNMFI